MTWPRALDRYESDLARPVALEGGTRVVGTTLADAYEACRLVTRHHAHAFYFSIRFLPPEKRRAIWAIYAICRYSDDLVDRAPATATPADLLARIDWWEARLRAMDTNLPIIRAFADAQVRFGIPTDPLWDLLAGMRMDLTHARYATWEDLRRYCYCVASTIGLLCTPVLGYDGAAETLDYAANLGVAMQLTNILRDVGADAAMGRIYLPQDEIAAFGYGEEQIAAGVVDAAFRRLMAFQIARARALYQESTPGIARLHRTGQLPVQAAATLYGGILGRIEAIDYHVYTHRAALSKWDKIVRLPAIWWQARTLDRA
ncbi:MAG: phytoene/squalene synthase family protein [Thermomicrobiales bacterium]